MLFEDLIKPDSVLCNAHARSKKHCLEIMSELLVRSNTDIAAEDIFDGLIERERLGCTSLDRGVAFPHCRVEGLKGNVGAFMKLSEPVEFDSPDGEATDLVFGLMVPADADADTQAEVGTIAAMLDDEKLRARLREANSSGQLYDSLVGTEPAADEAKRQAAPAG